MALSKRLKITTDEPTPVKASFEELLDSVKEGGAILRGEVEPSRVTKFSEPGVTTETWGVNYEVKDERAQHPLRSIDRAIGQKLATRIADLDYAGLRRESGALERELAALPTEPVDAETAEWMNAPMGPYTGPEQKAVPLPVVQEPEVIVTVSPGVEVISVADKPTFSSLEAATRELRTLLVSGESLKLKAARVVQAIRDQQLYKELGYPNFNAYLPELLKVTAEVGWNNKRSIQQYIAFVSVFLDQLCFPAEEAVNAFSHLNILLRLAQVDRKSGELVDGDGEKKLRADHFEGITQTVTFLVNTPSWAEDLATGADESITTARMAVTSLGGAAEVWNTLLGSYPSLPKGGWTVAHTRDLVDRLLGKAEEPADEGEEEETEEPPKRGPRRVWTVEPGVGETIRVCGLALYQGERLIAEFALDDNVTQEELAAMTDGDEVTTFADQEEAE